MTVKESLAIGIGFVIFILMLFSSEIIFASIPSQHSKNDCIIKKNSIVAHTQDDLLYCSMLLVTNNIDTFNKEVDNHKCGILSNDIYGFINEIGWNDNVIKVCHADLSECIWTYRNFQLTILED